MLTVGDKVTVKVLSVGEDGKISLSIRKASDNVQKELGKNTKEERNQREGDFRNNGKGNNHRNNGNAGFLKESDERLTSLKRNTEGKRGGRGGRRS